MRCPICGAISLGIDGIWTDPVRLLTCGNCGPFYVSKEVFDLCSESAQLDWMVSDNDRFYTSYTLRQMQHGDKPPKFGKDELAAFKKHFAPADAR